MHDINYMSNTLNLDFLNKFYIHEFWINPNLLLNSYNNIKSIINHNQLTIAFMLNSMFWLFISYGVNLKIFTVDIINTKQIIIEFNTKTLFYSYWRKFFIFNGYIDFNRISALIHPNFYANITKLNNAFLSTCNNIFYDKAFLAYFYFFKNYINESNASNIKNIYLYENNIQYKRIKNILNYNYIYNYNLKIISNIFIYNFYKYFNVYNILSIICVMLLGTYLFNVYRLSVIWYFGIIIFIKLLFITFFITNILRVSKKIYIIFYFFILSYVLNLFLYNEVNIELISITSLNILLVFALLIFYFFYKYNLFFLIFLELSITSGKSIIYVLKQYCRDILNMLAYLLRIFLLFIRLNIYDGLDDFFDSYYIFIGDFNSYDYLEFIYLFNFNLIPSVYDNIYDKSILNYEETEIYLNLFYLYSMIVLKFFIFLLLLLEGIFRLLLASYIFILVILEINNFNVIFIEHKN